MKASLLITIFLFASNAFSASWEVLQSVAERELLGQYSFQAINLSAPGHYDSFESQVPVTRIVLNRIDNPIQAFVTADIEVGLSLIEGTDLDRVEIFIYSGSKVRNCYANYTNGGSFFLSNCAKDSQ